MDNLREQPVQVQILASDAQYKEQYNESVGGLPLPEFCMPGRARSCCIKSMGSSWTCRCCFLAWLQQRCRFAEDVGEDNVEQSCVSRRHLNLVLLQPLLDGVLKLGIFIVAPEQGLVERIKKSSLREVFTQKPSIFFSFLEFVAWDRLRSLQLLQPARAQRMSASQRVCLAHCGHTCVEASHAFCCRPW
ncbi:hypothetical protein N657DRAFT_186665 [Parathielavia appendiculata]|uniref:Uncharacterized protein n=1 Tax=Parathielavia appendiculata TaxID=2587402 RepID=A0AAN6U5V0_9PEZI|nr:hypothetical protein N657DRAFT_186665 [Parathielavia appendiculata]